MIGNEAQSSIPDAPLTDQERTRRIASLKTPYGQAPARGSGYAARVAYQEISNLHFRLRILNLLLFFLPANSMARLRTLLYQLFGFQIGKSSIVLGNLTCSGEGSIVERLRIGERCILNSPLHLDLNGEIHIGDKVCIGHHVVIITTDHEMATAEFRCGSSAPKTTVIESGCWIGAGAMLLPGITIGAGSVVSAGAVVAADVPPNKVVVGNPARPVKTLE